MWDSGAIGFYMRDENKLDHVAYTVQVFQGTSIVCAQCHNHPFDKWSQMDYYGMAAFTNGMDTKGGGVNDIKLPKKPQGKAMPEFLAKMSPKERKMYMKEHPEEVAKLREEAKKGHSISAEEIKEVRQTLGDVMKPLRYTAVANNDGKLPRLPDDYKYTDGKPGQSIDVKAMFGHDAKPKEGQTRVHAFADWMTSPENPRFTTVVANRMWKKVFGLGLIEPVDEMTDSTVASNPALMDYLTQLMIEKKYALKDFLRLLYNTGAYQRAPPRRRFPQARCTTSPTVTLGKFNQNGLLACQAIYTATDADTGLSYNIKSTPFAITVSDSGKPLDALYSEASMKQNAGGVVYRAPPFSVKLSNEGASHVGGAKGCSVEQTPVD